MTIQTGISHEKETTLQLLEALFPSESLKGIRVRFWDDSFWPEYKEAITTLVLNYPGSLRAMRFVDEHTYRVWLLFMTGSIHGFKTRRLNIYQSLFVKPGERGDIRLPLTRLDWYKNCFFQRCKTDSLPPNLAHAAF